MRTGLRRSWAERAVLAVNLLAIAAALAVAAALDVGEGVASSVSRVELGEALAPRVADDEPGGGSFNVLLVGFDSAADLDPDDPVAIGRMGERLADVIIVARVDQTTDTATLLSIPRDLWVPISGTGQEAKINSAFQIGGPALLVETIDDVLGLPINHFASVDLAGFRGLVESVDHVDLAFAHPSRDWNPSPPSGPARSMTGFIVEEAGCRSLDAEQSLAFVRSRNFQVQIDGEWQNEGQRSDLDRIRRQQTFLQAFVDRAVDLGARNPLVLRDLLEAGVPHVTLDEELTVATLLDLGRAFDSFDSSRIESLSLPTEFDRVDGGISIVRTLEDEATPVLALLVGEDPTGPATIGVAVVIGTGDGGAADAGDVLDALGAAGFDPDVEEATGLSAAPGDGVLVAHGADGGGAAGVILTLLSDAGIDGTVVLDETIVGREVEIRLPAPAALAESTGDADAGSDSDGAAGPDADGTSGDEAGGAPTDESSGAAGGSGGDATPDVADGEIDPLPIVAPCG